MAAQSVKKAASEHFQERASFKEGIIYQIYPASFCDSDGDGMGVSTVLIIQCVPVDDVKGHTRYHLEIRLPQRSGCGEFSRAHTPMECNT